MALQRVISINLFQATSGDTAIDTMLSDQLLHLELLTESSALTMNSIPKYIAQTLLEHQLEKKYTHRYLNLLNTRRIPGTPFDRVKAVELNVAYDSRKCHLYPEKVAWCRCEGFTGIDSSTYRTGDGKQHSTDLFSGILLALMYDAPLMMNGAEVKGISLLRDSITVDGKIIIGAPEPLITFLSGFDYPVRTARCGRLSIEMFVLHVRKMKISALEIASLSISDLQEDGTYCAHLGFSAEGKGYTVQMIPSHAILLAMLMEFNEIYVDDKLLGER